MNHIETQQAKTPSHHFFFFLIKEKTNNYYDYYWLKLDYYLFNL